MKEEIDLTIDNYRKAVSRLREVCDAPENDLIRDALIQRFEFTFGQLWKTLRILLRDLKGEEFRFPKECLKAAFSAGWIEDDAVFNQMLLDRNEMSHAYNEAKSKEVAGRVRNIYLRHFEKVVSVVNRLAKEN